MAVRTHTKSTASLSARWITTSVMVHPPTSGLNDQAAGAGPEPVPRGGVEPFDIEPAALPGSAPWEPKVRRRVCLLLAGLQPPSLCSACRSNDNPLHGPVSPTSWFGVGPCSLRTNASAKSAGKSQKARVSPIAPPTGPIPSAPQPMPASTATLQIPLTPAD